MGNRAYLTGLISAGLLGLSACGSGGGITNTIDNDIAAPAPRVRDINAELQKLDELPVPDGVDPQLFEQLKAALRSQLSSYEGGRIVSSAPGKAHCRVGDFQLSVDPSGKALMDWSYASRGDYDQNSEVNVADLTPVGRWLGSNSGSGDWTKAGVADGDGNGEVNVADVTPIGQNFLMSIKGYHVMTAASPDSTDWQPVADVLFADAAPETAGGRLRFSFSLAAPLNNNWYCVEPYNADGAGPASDPRQFVSPKPKVSSVSPLQGKEGSTVSFSAVVSGDVTSWHWDFGAAATPSTSDEQSPSVQLGPAGIHGIKLTVGNSNGTTDYQFQFLTKQNAAPLAFINPAPASGSAPLNVVFDGGSSSDSDGEIVSYEWDFDGDGTYDETTGPLEPSASHTYTENGSYSAVLRVTDDSGAQGTQSTPVSVKAPIEGKWNLMIWFAADNNLAQDAVDDLEELEQFGSDNDINILAGYDIDPEWLWTPAEGTDKVHFIRVVKDSTPNSINTAGDPANQSFPLSGYNSAAPSSVRSFVDWCDANFPSEHSCLVLWDHGNGWRLGGTGTRSGSSVGPLPEVFKSTNPLDFRHHLTQRPLIPHGTDHPTRSGSGVLSDDTDGPWDLTSNGAIISALNGLHFDMLAFDACNMAHLESLYEYRQLSDWQVASETLVPGQGYAYDRLLEAWHAGFPASPEQIGRYFVDTVIEEYQPMSIDVTHGVYESAMIDPLVSQISAFTQTVTDNATTESTPFQNAMFDSFEALEGDGTRDFNMFVSKYTTQSANGQIDSELGGMQSASGNLVKYFREFLNSGASGMGIYLPSSLYFDSTMQSEYAQLPFNKATHWLEMLQALGLEGGGGGGGGIQLDWEKGDRVEISWPSLSSDMDMYLFEPNGDYSGAYEGSDLISSNLTASGDDPGLGPKEWLKLKNTAQSGPYELDLYYYDSSGGAPVDITVRLYDASGTLKQEIGVASLFFPGDFEFGFASLTLQ